MQRLFGGAIKKTLILLDQMQGSSNRQEKAWSKINESGPR
jgi:hypothetical protein